ncbi:hypothetical protein Rhopal_003996-T1 [Rhodotorula paludigena]|uniref:Dolichol-phosphate mannosyltransferase subunit 1 n=1 Tax=Rhodotorula paludigena TaxID=86838 RepID=A0AAV5GPN9_9BASI|nr:hypothetical protein Rhopal_003996-T1 [Rhodotorula paludigena]
MRWRTPGATLTPQALALVFVVTLFVSLVALRPAKSARYDPRSSARYAPPTDRDTPPDRPRIASSVVVPAYHERDNLAPLVRAVFAAVRDPAQTEVLIVDDNSRDGTEQECDRLRRDEGYNVELLVRTDEKGLSSAVLRGFERARGEKMVVMDADLQHPPSAVQPLLDALTPSTPLALGTRYGQGVSMSSGWPLHRRIISWGARVLARPLTSASDPMTGFFAITKEQFRRSHPINPSGFKIALELLLKSPLPHASSTLPEVPYSFGLRTSGSSKLSSKVMLKYVGQLVSLYVWSWGLAFHLALALAVTVALWVGERAWRRRRRGLSRGSEFPLGGMPKDAGTPPLSPKGLGRSKLRSSGGPSAPRPRGGGTAAGQDALRSWTAALGGGSGGAGDGQVLERKRFV